MENGLAQGIGGIAFMVGVMAFWQKDDLRFRYQMMAFCFIMGVHFVLLGATVAAIGWSLMAFAVSPPSKPNHAK